MGESKTLPKTIAEWSKYIMEWSDRKGWNTTPDGGPLILSEIIANLHTEISEAWEEIRNGHTVDEVYTNDAVWAKQRELPSKPEGFPIEMADLAIRLFHLVAYYGINLEAMIALKMKYNESRPFRHGGKIA